MKTYFVKTETSEGTFTGSLTAANDEQAAREIKGFLSRMQVTWLMVRVFETNNGEPSGAPFRVENF